MLTEKNTLEDLINGLMTHGVSSLENSLCDDPEIARYHEILENEKLEYPRIKSDINPKNWYIPEEYKNMDIEDFLVSRCPEQNYQRLTDELELYRKNDMLDVLKSMKYLVDTLRKNGIVWGVGRGSSVSSYVLFLIGIHKIDSVKYNLPIDEFFKGETNE
jgi:DNA polymerase III alpha subunit